MNIQDISKMFPALYTARKIAPISAGTAEAGTATNSGLVDRYEAAPRIEGELPGPDGPVSSATPDVLRRYVMDTLVRQYSGGNSYFRLLYDQEVLPELLGPAAARTQASGDELRRIEDVKRANPEYETAVRLVGGNGDLSPRSVAAAIGAAAQMMLNLNPQQNSGFQSAVRFAFSDFGRMFGGELPPITQQTLMTFTRDYDPFRSDVHTSEADDPVSEIPESGLLRDV